MEVYQKTLIRDILFKMKLIPMVDLLLRGIPALKTLNSPCITPKIVDQGYQKYYNREIFVILIEMKLIPIVDLLLRRISALETIKDTPFGKRFLFRPKCVVFLFRNFKSEKFQH